MPSTAVLLYTVQQGLPISLNIEKFNQIQGGKGVKGPSERIFIFVFDVFYVIACDLKISIYKVNSPHKKMCTHESYFQSFFANNLLKGPQLILKMRLGI